MRLSMQEYDKFMGKFWGVYGSRFSDDEKLDAIIE